MAAPPKLSFLLLLLVSAFSHASSAAENSNSDQFPPTTPLHLQHALGHQRLRQESSPEAKLAAAAADGTDTMAELPFTEHYFPQELDHFTFTPNASTVFYQKYLVNDTFWRRPGGGNGGGTGPLFVYAGGEIGIEWIAINAGFMFDIAPKFGALLVFIEHRFYGESVPFGSNSAEALGYLTSTQALADFAILITSLKQNLSAETAP